MLTATVLVVLTFPLLLIVALAVDVVRRSLTTVQLLGLFTCFLLVETASLIALGLVGLCTSSGSPRRIAGSFAVGEFYARTLLRAAMALFRLRLAVEGEELVDGGPVIAFMRHASILDVLLPSDVITARHGIRLRYVLKRELLIDPVLDVAGHWGGHSFVTRSHLAPQQDVEKIRALKAGLGARGGVLIYPEGTRFMEQKRQRILERLKNDPVALARAQRLRHLLPVHPGGPLALLDAAPECDVLFVGHRGLEGFATLREIWRRGLSARTIRVRFWREPASSVPRDRAARLDWLSQRWQRLDDWLEATRDRGSD